MKAKPLNRRSFLEFGITSAPIAKHCLFGNRVAGSVIHDSASISVTGRSDAALQPFDRLMTGFLKAHDVPGASLAVSRHGKLVYARGFGIADPDSGRPVEPDSLFRIASVSKPITAVAAIRSLGPKSIPLDTPVFDVLPSKVWLRKSSDPRLRRITIRHLMQHRAGWDRNQSFDPIGRPAAAVRSLEKSLPASPEDILKYTLTLPLDFDPGTRFAYSNVGYLLLGRVIELFESDRYESVIQKKVLRPCGITTMKLGRARAEDLDPLEVRYLDRQKRIVQAVNGPKPGAPVPLVYGGENFEGFEAHGGWIGSAIDLVTFASAVNAIDHPLVSADEYRTMIERPEGSAGFDSEGNPRPAFYGCGWNVRPVGRSGKANTWHNGMIAGTSALLVRRHDGLNWAVLFNTDRAPTGEILANLIDPLVHHAADAVERWPDT